MQSQKFDDKDDYDIRPFGVKLAEQQKDEQQPPVESIGHS